MGFSGSGWTFAALLALLALSPGANTTRVRGSWRYDSEHRLKYLTKFGVQDGHDVVAYGRSVRSKASSPGFRDGLVLAFVSSQTWEDFYNAEKKSRRKCKDFMEGPFNASRSPDARCSHPGTEDLYRVVPCDYQQECGNQLGPPVPGSNLTFRVTSLRTQFYYLFLVGCRQDYNTTGTCQWLPSVEVSIDYDLHIVNQDPQTTVKPNPFVYEFSYNLIGMMIVYIIFSCIYFTVTIFHLLMHSCLCTPHGYKHHRLTFVYSVSLVLEAVHVILVMIHYCVFSWNGIGVKPLFFIGQATNFLSDWLLILVLILIGKGWQITTATVRWKKVTLVVWIMYIVMSGIFFVWIVVQETVFPFSAQQTDVHQTWAGGLYIAYRLLLLLYIMWEIRQIYLVENKRFRLVLYRTLAVLYVVWFCYLPVAVIIASILNPLERPRIVVVFILTFDLVINLVMVLLMCPKWSQLYFQFSSHLNSLTRVTMRRGLARYSAVSNSIPSEEH